MDVLEAVIFEWGSTLARWHDVDFHAEWVALAQVVVNSEHEHVVVAGRLHAASESSWGRSRERQQSAPVGYLFTGAGLEHDPELLTAYYEFSEPHTLTDPQVGPLWEGLRERGLRVGVFSKTIWPRECTKRAFAATASIT